MAKTYSLVVGVVLLLVGIVGFVKSEEGLLGLQFSLVHNLIHALSGVIGIWAGMSKTTGNAKKFAQIFGVVYTLVALVGFVGQPAFVTEMLNLNTPYNVIHLAVGLLGILAGFAPMKAATA